MTSNKVPVGPLKMNQSSLTIYKRPKDDDEELKESSLSPQQYAIPKTHSLLKAAVPDLKLFENMNVVEKCKAFVGAEHDDEIILCPAMKRMMAVLNYYNSLMVKAVNGNETFAQLEFIEFCDRCYGQKSMLEDHIHFVTNHSDLVSSTAMATTLKWKCFGFLKDCNITTRHYRNRQQEEQEEVHFYIDIMDSLHFNMLHLVDAGLRVNIVQKDDDDPNELNENHKESVVDQKMLKIAQQIHRKRQQCFFERLDETKKNSKYSLCSTVVSNDGIKCGITKMDSVLKDFKKEIGDEAVVHRLVAFMDDQRYDTETMNEDMAVYAESKQCNVRMAMKVQDDGGCFGALRRWLRYHRVSGSSFSTGIWWAYWPWYKEQTIDSLMNNKRRLWRQIDFGGHSMESLCVSRHFENLKEEALGSDLIPNKFWTKLMKKATRYLHSARCKKMVDRWNWGYSLKFEVSKKGKVTVQHLLSLLLYTDSSEYCTALSETFRAITSGETIEEMNRRNSLYYWTSRYLRELVLCFGSFAKRAKSTYFTGISYEMSIPQFRIGLVGPTSTSMAKEVAVRFAGEKGMLIMLKGGDSTCFDASVFSAYPEEQERIFCGSTKRETVASIVLVKSARNYKVAIGAYSKFDAIFSGLKAEFDDRERRIIMKSLQWINGCDDAIADQKMLDTFILETFYSFIIHKKMIYLNFNELYKVKNDQIVHMVVNPLWNKSDADSDNKPMNVNLLKPFVFNLFRDINQIRIWTGNDYPFDLMLFLKMMHGADLPEKLERILIERGLWIQQSFSGKVKSEYEFVGITAKTEGDQWTGWSLSLMLNK